MDSFTPVRFSFNRVQKFITCLSIKIDYFFLCCELIIKKFELSEIIIIKSRIIRNLNFFKIYFTNMKYPVKITQSQVRNSAGRSGSRPRARPRPRPVRKNVLKMPTTLFRFFSQFSFNFSWQRCSLLLAFQWRCFALGL